jgi:cell division protein FtsB
VCLCQFKIIYVMLGVLLLLIVSLFMSHFGVSAWRLKYTKHMCCNSDVVQ